MASWLAELWPKKAAESGTACGRQVPWMFEQFFETNEEAGTLYSAEDLLNVALVKDDLIPIVWNWESVIPGMSRVPEELTLCDIVLRRVPIGVGILIVLTIPYAMSAAIYAKRICPN